MNMQNLTLDEIAEIHIALGDRVNQLITQRKEGGHSAPMSRLLDRQLERTNNALARVETIIYGDSK